MPWLFVGFPRFAEGYLVTGLMDGRVLAWEAKSATSAPNEILSLEAHKGAVTSLSFPNQVRYTVRSIYICIASYHRAMRLFRSFHCFVLFSCFCLALQSPGFFFWTIRDYKGFIPSPPPPLPRALAFNFVLFYCYTCHVSFVVL